MLKQVTKETRAFALGPTRKSNRVRRIDIERLAAGFGMRSNNRVFGGEIATRLRTVALDPIFTCARDIGFGGGMHCAQPVQHGA